MSYPVEAMMFQFNQMQTAHGNLIGAVQELIGTATE